MNASSNANRVIYDLESGPPEQMNNRQNGPRHQFKASTSNSRDYHHKDSGMGLRDQPVSNFELEEEIPRSKMKESLLELEGPKFEKKKDAGIMIEKLGTNERSAFKGNNENNRSLAPQTHSKGINYANTSKFESFVQERQGFSSGETSFRKGDSSRNTSSGIPNKNYIADNGSNTIDSSNGKFFGEKSNGLDKNGPMKWYKNPIPGEKIIGMPINAESFVNQGERHKSNERSPEIGQRQRQTRNSSFNHAFGKSGVPTPNGFNHKGLSINENIDSIESSEEDYQNQRGMSFNSNPKPQGKESFNYKRDFSGNVSGIAKNNGHNSGNYPQSHGRSNGTDIEEIGRRLEKGRFERVVWEWVTSHGLEGQRSQTDWSILIHSLYELLMQKEPIDKKRREIQDEDDAGDWETAKVFKGFIKSLERYRDDIISGKIGKIEEHGTKKK